MPNGYQDDEWEGGPVETGPVEGHSAPDDPVGEQLDQKLAELDTGEDDTEFTEPEIAETGPPAIPDDVGEQLDSEVADLETNDPFEFTNTDPEPASDPEELDIPDTDLDDDSPSKPVDDAAETPDTLLNYLKGKSHRSSGGDAPDLGSNAGESAAMPEDLEHVFDGAYRGLDAIVSHLIDYGRRMEDATSALERSRL